MTHARQAASIEHGRFPRVGAAGLLLAIAAAFVLIAGRGLDFGRHWDEDALIDKVEWSIVSGGVLLPPTYDWPSASYWVALAALLPELPAVAGVTSADLSNLEQHLVAAIRGERYLMRLRWLFASLTALSIVWVFAASRALGGGLIEAACAAAVLALAWEPAYHARFAVPDGLLMQFGALTLWCTARAARAPHERWLFAAAVAGGFAIGTKYSAWPILLPVIWIAAAGVHAPLERARRAATVAGIAVAAFLVTTPGALFMPFRFVQALILQTRHYASGHGVHTIGAGLDHLWRMGEYFAFELLSPFAPIALLFALLSVIGVVVLVRQSPMLAVAVAAFPIAYIMYFSLQRVMIVRNLLILAPFFAVTAARAIGWSAGTFPTPALRRVPYALAALAMAMNLTFQLGAASGIEQRRAINLADEARWWIARSDGSAVGLSSAVFTATADGVPRAQPLDETRAEQWLTFLDEPVCGEPLPANVRGLITLVAGPREVNVTRYPDWIGDRHLVVVDLQVLRRHGRCKVTTG